MALLDGTIACADCYEQATGQRAPCRVDESAEVEDFKRAVSTPAPSQGFDGSALEILGGIVGAILDIATS